MIVDAYRYQAQRRRAIVGLAAVTFALSAALLRGWLAARGVWWPARMWVD